MQKLFKTTMLVTPGCNFNILNTAGMPRWAQDPAGVDVVTEAVPQVWLPDEQRSDKLHLSRPRRSLRYRQGHRHHQTAGRRGRPEPHDGISSIDRDPGQNVAETQAANINKDLSWNRLKETESLRLETLVCWKYRSAPKEGALIRKELRAGRAEYGKERKTTLVYAPTSRKQEPDDEPWKRLPRHRLPPSRGLLEDSRRSRCA